MFSWAASKTKKMKDKVVDAAKSVKDKVTEKVSKAWGAYTGKTNAEKAEALYAEISNRYDRETKKI